MEYLDEFDRNEERRRNKIAEIHAKRVEQLREAADKNDI